MERPERKATRLVKYNYSQNGAYFITVCTHDKECLLGTIVGGGVLDAPHMELSHYGKIVQTQIDQMVAFYEYLHIEKYVVMPNHIHLIIMVHENHGSSRTPTPTVANAILPQFVSTLKRYTNKNIGYSIWQRSYHDRVIRDEQEYQKIWQYIDTNPVKWNIDCYHSE